MTVPTEDSSLDELILSNCKEHWQKVAMIIARTASASASESDCARVGGRIEQLVVEGRLEGQGNLKEWRHSEVRLPVK